MSKSFKPMTKKKETVENSPKEETTTTQPDNTVKKVVKPELPTKNGVKNDTLKCVVVVDGAMTYFGKENPNAKEIADKYVWRATVNPQKLFAKIDAINADANLVETQKQKAITAAFQSMTYPMTNGVQWIHKLETTAAGAFPTTATPSSPESTPEAPAAQ